MTHPIDDGSFQYRHCLKKKAYGSEALALAVIASAMQRKPSLRLWCYQCRICHFWHLTSKAPREKAA